MSTFIAYIIILFFVASLKLAWFETLLPVHVFHFMHKLGINYGIKDWDNFNEHESTREDWELFMASSPYYLLTNLLTCPVCLSFHLSFWCSAIVFAGSFFCENPVMWLIIPISTVTIPYIVNKVLK
jgi:hypothetical protein